MASRNNFKISPGMPSVAPDFFFPIFYNSVLIMLIEMVNRLPESAF
jgi:hypothetical protein